MRTSPVLRDVASEAQDGGPIALLKDGDVVTIDADAKSISVAVSDDEMARRRAAWTAPPFPATRGTLYKYIKNVSDASHGCVTDG
jgi:dihydroxy-acid dehydratase